MADVSTEEEVVIEVASKEEPEKFKPPPPEVHLKELLDGLDNEELQQRWDKEMENAKDPVKDAYKKLPTYKRLKIKDGETEWFGIIASLHNIEEPEPKVVFTCYLWTGKDDKIYNKPFEMSRLEDLTVAEGDDFNNSVEKLRLAERIKALTEAPTA